MAKQLLINVAPWETRVALLDDTTLVEVHIERRGERSIAGNIYKGRVTRVLPGMQAAFVDIGLEKSVFLHASDVGTPPLPPEVAREGDAPEELVEPTGRPTPRPIEERLQKGQEILVQVSKEPMGTKGARVTSHISLPGRYVVYLPTVDHIGISKRIGSDKERQRLRESIDAMKPPTGGLVVRTLAEGLTKKQLKADVGYLVRLWGEVAKKREEAKKAPVCLYTELDLVLKTARDLFSDDIEKIVAATPDSRQTMLFSATLDGVVGNMARRITKDPLTIQVNSTTTKHENIVQRVHFVDDLSHKNRLLDHLLRDETMDQAVVFTATRRDADTIADRLNIAGFSAAALHGDMHQGARNRTLDGLRRGNVKVLVATDVAARGIDVPNITPAVPAPPGAYRATGARAIGEGVR